MKKPTHQHYLALAGLALSFLCNIMVATGQPAASVAQSDPSFFSGGVSDFDPTIEPSTAELTVRECFKVVRNSCNCGLVNKGSPCVEETVRDECGSGGGGSKKAQTYKKDVRSQYKEWCREQIRGKSSAVKSNANKRKNNNNNKIKKKKTKKNKKKRNTKNKKKQAKEKNNNKRNQMKKMNNNRNNRKRRSENRRGDSGSFDRYFAEEDEEMEDEDDDDEEEEEEGERVCYPPPILGCYFKKAAGAGEL